MIAESLISKRQEQIKWLPGLSDSKSDRVESAFVTADGDG